MRGLLTILVFFACAAAALAGDVPISGLPPLTNAQLVGADMFPIVDTRSMPYVTSSLNITNLDKRYAQYPINLASSGAVFGILPVLQGGTGSTTASGARSDLGAAASGANADITSLSALSTPLSVLQGGTGLASGTSGGIPAFTASGTLTSSNALPANGVVYGGGPGFTPGATAAGSQNQVLTVNASGAPVFAQVQLASSAAVTGTLPIANGGTGATASQAAINALAQLTTKGDIEAFNGTNVVPQSVGSDGQVLTASSGAVNGVAWQTGNGASVSSVGFTGPGGIFGVTGSPVTSSGTISETVTGNSGGIPGFTAAGTLTSSAALPAGGVVFGGGAGFTPGATAAGTGGQVLVIPSGTSTPSFGAVLLSSGAAVSGTLATGNGGTGSATTQGAINNLSQLSAKGDLECYSGSNTTRCPVGGDGNVLIASSGAVNGVVWGNITSAGGGTVSSVALADSGGIFSISGSPITSSGTITESVAGSSGGVPYFSSASQLSSSGALTSGRPVLGGGAGTAPFVATAGAVNTVLVWNGTTASFAAVNLSSSAAVTGTLPVGNGGTGDTSFTSNAVVVGNNTSGLAVVTNNSSGTNEFLTQSSSGAPAWQTIAAGDVPSLDASKITTGTLGASRIPTNMNASTFGSSTTQYSPAVAVRSSLNAIEFGNGNTSGYGSVLGEQGGNGQPFLCFSCGQDGVNTNKYQTFGNKGTVILGDIAGGLSIQEINTATGTNLTPSNQSLVTSGAQVGLGGAGVSANGNVTVNIKDSMAIGDVAGFFTTVSSSASCTSTCSSASSAHGFGTNAGQCVFAWNTGGGANTSCSTSGSFNCLCAGGR